MTNNVTKQTKTFTHIHKNANTIAKSNEIDPQDIQFLTIPGTMIRTLTNRASSFLVTDLPALRCKKPEVMWKPGDPTPIPDGYTRCTTIDAGISNDHGKRSSSRDWSPPKQRDKSSKSSEPSNKTYRCTDKKR
ncbi:unnamed protein product [Didymodactylos carnosus]|uniref:Uncharacterized protein n=1 Tax=Didymodactylos carnosus TaxID=1234261 RepID=A0A813T8W9_9BILA|nr:unnamed protein product [Didymodactylos carnosus]CAF0809209.1 unnamed protein product [Didymodactylos carnosus]CAF3535928.1 unnamed protein product [Didymodactylos carnosus]CAF3594768.1 unnamed protein product [Didymodactylos carnosus]